MTTRLLLLATACVALPGIASAQTVDERTDGTAFASASPSSTDSAQPRVTFDLEVSDDESKASAQIGGYLIQHHDEAGGGHRQITGTWSVKGSLPIGGGDDLTNTTLNMLTRGPSLTASISFLSFGTRPGNSSGYAALFGKDGPVRANCRKAATGAGVVIGDVVAANRASLFDANGVLLVDAQRKIAIGRITKLVNEQLVKANIEAPDAVVEQAIDAAIKAAGTGGDEATIRKAAADTAAIEASQPAAVGVPGSFMGACETPGYGPGDTVVARRYSGKTDAEINRLAFTPTERFGFELTVGVDRYDYLEVATLTPQDPAKPSYSGAFYFGHYFASGTDAVIGRIQYSNGFESADETILCKPVVVDPTKDCAKGRATQATNFERLNLSAEWRHIFTTGWRAGDFAASPKVTLDALSGDWEGLLPLYFVPKQDWPVSPGVTIKYSSKTNDVNFGLFLRSSFTF